MPTLKTKRLTLTHRGFIWRGDRYRSVAWWPRLEPDERKAGITRGELRRDIRTRRPT